MRTATALTLAGALLSWAPSAAAPANGTAVTMASTSVHAIVATPHLCAGSHSTKGRTYAAETYWGPERVTCAKCMEYGRYKVAHRVIHDFTCIRYTGHTILLAQLSR